MVWNLDLKLYLRWANLRSLSVSQLPGPGILTVSSSLIILRLESLEKEYPLFLMLLSTKDPFLQYLPGAGTSYLLARSVLLPQPKEVDLLASVLILQLQKRSLHLALKQKLRRLMSPLEAFRFIERIQLFGQGVVKLRHLQVEMNMKTNINQNLQNNFIVLGFYAIKCQERLILIWTDESQRYKKNQLKVKEQIQINEYQHAVIKIFLNPTNFIHQNNIFLSRKVYQMQKQQFGIMDEGYFVPKSEILAWVNALLQINITKIEALGSGSIYCQIFDVIHPGKINLAKVNWKTKNDNDFLANFRLLQTACQKIGIKRHIEVEKLVKAKYQDNLQFIQWFKRYFDTNCGSKGQGYEAVEKRNKVVPDFSFCEKLVVPKVFNGTGQTAKENKLSSPNAKKEEMPPRVKSPRNIKTPVATAKKTPVVPKKVEQKKEQPKKIEPKKIQEKKQPIKILTKPPPKKPEPPKVQEKVPKTATTVNKRPTTAVEPIKKGVQNKNEAEIQKLKQKLKEVTQKVDMIKEVVISQDGSDMKIELIKEVLGIATQKPKTQQTVWVSQTQENQDIQSKQTQQSVTENVSNANEELLMTEQPESEQTHTEKTHTEMAFIEEPPISQAPSESQQEQSRQEESQQEQPQQEDLLQQEPQQEGVQQSEAPQEQSHPEQKPDLSESNAPQAQQDDDVI